MPEDGERERHINMHMSPEAMAGAYANFANISHSDYEFTITFARLDHDIDEDEIPGVVVSRISASGDMCLSSPQPPGPRIGVASPDARD